MRKRIYSVAVSREDRKAEIRVNRLVRNGREYVAQWLELFEAARPASPVKEERDNDAPISKPF